jgi:hypothetical protein
LTINTQIIYLRQCMLSCKYFVVGDDYIAHEALNILTKKNNKVIYANASQRFIEEADYISIIQCLSKYTKNTKSVNKTKLFNELALFKLEYSRRMNYLLSTGRLIHLQGQPELFRESIAGVHIDEVQQLINYQHLIYLPSAKNFVENTLIKDHNAVKNVYQIFNDITRINKIAIITDKSEDIELAYLLTKIGIHVRLFIPSYYINILNKMGKIDLLKSYEITEIKEINIKSITLQKNIDKKTNFDEIYYNYNSLVNHQYFNLNESILPKIIVYGDSINQNYYSSLINLEERYGKSTLELLYEENYYSVQYLKLKNTYLSYSNETKKDEIVKSIELDYNRIKCKFLLNKKEEIISADVIGDDSLVDYFFRRIRINLKLKDAVNFLNIHTKLLLN